MGSSGVITRSTLSGVIIYNTAHPAAIEHTACSDMIHIPPVKGDSMYPKFKFDHTYSVLGMDTHTYHT